MRPEFMTLDQIIRRMIYLRSLQAEIRGEEKRDLDEDRAVTHDATYFKWSHRRSA